MSRANCLGLDPNVFFPGQGEDQRQAKEACAGCVVRVDCLEYALRMGQQYGIWGGKSERERNRIRRARRKAA